MKTKILIITPIPNSTGAWGYKAYADRLQFGGSTPAEAVRSAYDRCMVGKGDEIHVCTNTGTEIKSLKDFGI